MKNGNPAVVGLAGFGMTTLLLQIHNLGLLEWGPVIAMGIIFGGLAQMIAGFQEQKNGKQLWLQCIRILWCILDRAKHNQAIQSLWHIHI